MGVPARHASPPGIARLQPRRTGKARRAGQRSLPRKIHPTFFQQMAFIFSIYGLYFVGNLPYKTSQLFEKTSKYRERSNHA